MELASKEEIKAVNNIKASFLLEIYEKYNHVNAFVFAYGKFLGYEDEEN